jgi:hydroxypyruvate reductase
MPDADPRRRFLLDLFARGLAAVDGRARMRAALARRSDGRETWILAVGKAAPAMALGALDALPGWRGRALVVSRSGHFLPGLEQRPGVTCLAAGHPLPDERSLAAGAAALGFAAAVPRGARVLLLVSGGASSLLEVPAEGVALDDLRRFNGWALASGRPIGEVNALRRRLSAVKGGRLLQRLAHAQVEGYAISDVPGDDPAVIGSGLLAAAPAEVLPGGLPEWLEALLSRARGPAPDGAACPVALVARLKDALDAVGHAAAEAGIPVLRAPTRLAGDPAAAAAAAVEALRGRGPALYVAGGETTVRLPPQPGRGGRNQHLALEAALRMAGDGELLLLAAGTDGSDGDTDDAGALVDGSTVERAAQAGIDAATCLARADSGALLAATGELVHTGPTGTNVGDLVLGLRCARGHRPGAGCNM